VTDTATATGVGVIGGASPKSDPSTVTIPTVAQPPEPGGDGPGPVDGGVPVGGVQTGGLPAPAGHAARGAGRARRPDRSDRLRAGAAPGSPPIAAAGRIRAGPGRRRGSRNSASG